MLAAARDALGQRVTVVDAARSAGLGIERHLARLQMPANLVQVLLVDVELGGEQLGRDVDARGEQFLPLLLEPEEQLAPRARVADVDEARVRHQEAEHVGADPVGGVGAEARPQLRLPALDRLHEADAALLEQVQDVGPRAAVLVGDRDDEAQVVNHQRARRVQVAALARRDAQRAFLFLRQPLVTLRLRQEAPDLIADGRQRRPRAAGPLAGSLVRIEERDRAIGVRVRRAPPRRGCFALRLAEVGDLLVAIARLVVGALRALVGGFGALVRGLGSSGPGLGLLSLALGHVGRLAEHMMTRPKPTFRSPAV